MNLDNAYDDDDDYDTDETLALTTSHNNNNYNTSRNRRHRMALPMTAIASMMFIFVVMGAFVSYTHQDHVVKVVSRHHPSIWGNRQNNNTGRSIGIGGTKATGTTNATKGTSSVDRSNHHRPRNKPSNSSKSTTDWTNGSTDTMSLERPSLSPTGSHSKTTVVDAFLPWNVTADTTQRQLPKPHSIQMIYQYYKMHSVVALRQDLSPPQRRLLEDNDEATHRTFSLAFLPCVRHNQTSKNNKEEELSYFFTSEILHNFFNTLVWSIMTNRTVIVQWYDPTATHEPNRNHIHLKNATEQFYTCTIENQQNQPPSRSSPASILSLTPWMVQWSDILKYHPTLIHDTIVPIPIDLYRQQYDSRHSVVVFPQSQEQFHIHPSPNPQPAMFYNQWFQHPLGDTNGIQYVKYLPEWNRHVTLELYNEGSDFLYGALFRICFPEYDQPTSDKTIPILPAAFTTKTNQPSKDVVSFVLVSVPESTNKINIDSEIKCLRQMLPLSDDPITCQIVLLSSNPTIVERITDWITSSKRQCTVLHTSPNRRPDSLSDKASHSFSGKAPSVKSNDDDKSDDDHEPVDDEGGDDDEDGDDDDDNDDKGSRKRNAVSKHGNGHRNAQKQTTDSGNDSARHSYRIPLSDIAMASKIVRTGVIGYTDHPDFQLLVEWIAYHRQMEYYDNNNHDNDRPQRRRRTISISTSASDSIEPLLWCEL